MDKALSPAHGVTREGQPLSYNRAPAADLAPWIGWLYVSDVEAPADHRLECGLFNDVAMVRLQLKGRWHALTADGPLEHERAALFFGPQTRRMPVSVTGSFFSIGFSLRPGTGHAVMGANAADYLDRIVDCAALCLPGDAALAQLDGIAEPEARLQLVEDMIRQIVHRPGVAPPDPVTARFEAMAFAAPSASIADCAAECGVTQRQLERIVRRDFGMAPKQVLRRARALDMGSHLRGVADREEAEELMLRYYDQSHLIRDFTQLFGMSPSQFVARPQPLLTLALESRQARRLELIERVPLGGQRPWQ
ncbi:helix-turn-helix domain-containing protein [Novosphingobium bradum]|uniref:Helix-turn-helix domain-containing protein n=1 Tax=Novosphingobium bradum TaxID=1737444 RepID=A0ABV7IXH6_9SPHN